MDILNLDKEGFRGKLRTCQINGVKMVSLIDLIRISSHKTPTEASHTLKEVSGRFPYVSRVISNFKFPGQGQRLTPVADAEGVVKILMLLPGKKAAQFRQSCAQIIVRYLGGDLSLCNEIQALNSHQERIRQKRKRGQGLSSQEEGAAFFGDAVVPKEKKVKLDDVQVVQAKVNLMKEIEIILKYSWVDPDWKTSMIDQTRNAVCPSSKCITNGDNDLQWLSIEGMLNQMGVTKPLTQKSLLGRRMASRWRQEQKGEPEKKMKWVNGEMRSVNVYPKEYMRVFQEVYDELYP